MALQSDQTNPRKKPRKPKIKSKRGRGGDRVSLKFQREQARLDGEVYRLVSEGFQLAQAASALGISEDTAGPAYRRALGSLRLATVEEAKGQALDRIRYRRTILYAEIQKRRAAVGGDKKRLMDSGDLRALFDAAHQLDVRESRLMGLDAPLRSLIGWTGVAPSEDLLTAEQLDRLSVDQLRQLHDLLEIAHDPRRSIETTARPVIEPLNFQVAEPTPPTPEPSQPDAPVFFVEPETPTHEDPDHYKRLREAEGIIERLNGIDPLTAVSDPIQRRELTRQANRILLDFGRPAWTDRSRERGN